MSIAREHYEVLLRELCEGARLGNLAVEISLYDGSTVFGVPRDTGVGAVCFDDRVTRMSTIDAVRLAGPVDR